MVNVFHRCYELSNFQQKQNFDFKLFLILLTIFSLRSIAPGWWNLVPFYSWSKETKSEQPSSPPLLELPRVKGYESKKLQLEGNAEKVHGCGGKGMQLDQFVESCGNENEQLQLLDESKTHKCIMWIFHAFSSSIPFPRIAYGFAKFPIAHSFSWPILLICFFNSSNYQQFFNFEFAKWGYFVLSSPLLFHSLLSFSFWNFKKLTTNPFIFAYKPQLDFVILKSTTTNINGPIKTLLQIPI